MRLETRITPNIERIIGPGPELGQGNNSKMKQNTNLSGIIFNLCLILPLGPRVPWLVLILTNNIFF